MYQPERQLQQLRQRFAAWLPWLKQALKADVTISPTGQGNCFVVTARWNDGEHRKVYDGAAVIAQGRVRCTKDYARSFMQEVLQKRGVL
jgi:hypothetical protein